MSFPITINADVMEKGQATSTQDGESPSPVSRNSSFFSLLRSTASLLPRSSSSTPSQKSNAIVRSSVKVQKLQECPEGYPRLAAFQCSDESFLIYRRFGYLQSRVLLDKQDRLRRLEIELNELDNELFAKRAAFTKTCTKITDRDLRDRRAILMSSIADAYCSYSNVLLAASQVVALNSPAESDYRSVDSFSIDEPLCQGEHEWIQHKEDLITLRPGREHSWLDKGIEHLLRLLHCRFVEWIFCSAETKQKTEGRDQAKEVYYTRSRIAKLVNTIILIVILVLLVIPTYLLYHLVTTSDNGKTHAACMGILLAATLSFSAVLAAFTRAKRHEILAAAAAYCAVLVVFLGNVPQTPN